MEDGHTTTVTNKEEHLMETRRWPYECCDLLESVNNEELPILYMKLILTYAPNAFYSGCIIMEIRDYRQSYPISDCCDNYYVLLRPTTQTLLADLNNLAMGAELTHIDRLVLEGHMVLVSACRLCIHPSAKVGRKAIYNNCKKNMWNTPDIRRQMRRFSQVAINRKQKTDQFTRSYKPELMDYLSRHKERTQDPSAPNKVSWKIPSRPATSIRPIRDGDFDLPVMDAPRSLNVFDYAKAFGTPRGGRDCSPNFIEEYIFETTKIDLKVNHIKLKVYHRLTMDEYLGRIWLNRAQAEESEETEDGLPTAPFFSLGTRNGVTSYVQQLTVIITEEGRRSIKITHSRPGQEPKVIKTVGMCIGPASRNRKS